MAHKEDPTPSEAGNGGKVACTLAWGSAFTGVERGSLGFRGHFSLVNLKVRAGRGEKQPSGQLTKSLKIPETKETCGCGRRQPSSSSSLVAGHAFLPGSQPCNGCWASKAEVRH